MKNNYDIILSCEAGVWGLIGRNAFCLHQINLILSIFFFYKNHGLTRNNDTVSILQRIIFKVRKNTMNKIITVTTFTKEYFCRITVHFYRGGENTRIKEMCVLQVMYSGIHSLLLKKMHWVTFWDTKSKSKYTVWKVLTKSLSLIWITGYTFALLINIDINCINLFEQN